jgi:hypothetical protein
LKSLDVDDDGDESTDVPAKSQFNMVAECAYDYIPFETTALALLGAKLRLCHLAELAVYRQVCRLSKTMANPSKSDLRARMMNRKKIVYIAPFVPFKGLVPYNPSKLISLIPPFIHARIHTASKWSKSINLTSLGLENITITSTGLTFNDKEEVFEFGLFSTKGQGVFQMTTVVCMH